jgi:hypothetical protein
MRPLPGGGNLIFLIFKSVCNPALCRVFYCRKVLGGWAIAILLDYGLVMMAMASP